MLALQFRLLGKFTVYYNQKSLDFFNVQKVQELLCYLLVHRDRPHNREVLAELLWGNVNTPYSKKYLRKTLWQLQTALRSIPATRRDKLLIIDPHWIQVNKDAAFWLDIPKIEDIFASIRGKSGKALTRQEFDDLQQAVNLYKGDLLEGWFQDWCVYYRVRLREMFTHSFIIKVWLEEISEDVGTAVWRGQITHVLSGKQRYVKSLQEVMSFMDAYFQQMGVRLSLPDFDHD